MAKLQAHIQAAYLDCDPITVIDIMAQNLKNADTQEICCGALCALSEGDGKMRDMIISCGGLRSLMTAMQGHTKVGPVQEKACRTFLNLCLNLKSARKVTEAGAVRAVATSMGLLPDDKGTQHWGTRFFFCLSQYDELSGKVGQENGIGRILAAMTVLKNNANMQEWCFRALSNLSLNDHNKKKLLDEGAVEALLRIMKRQSDLRTQEKACDAIMNMALDPVLRQRIGSAGGIPIILRAMELYKDKVEMQRRGCKAIGRLAGSSENGAKIQKEQGLPAVMDAMKLFHDDNEVQEAACMAICNLALHDSPRVEAVSLGALPAIFKSMNDFKDDVGVQKMGCGAIGTVTHDAEFAEQAGTEAIDLVLRTIRTYTKDRGVQEYTLGAINNLAGFIPNSVKIVEAGGIESVIQLMKEHTEVVFMQLWGSATLLRLGHDQASADRVAKAGGIDTILYAMKKHASDSGVQEFASGAFGTLAGRSHLVGMQILEKGGLMAVLKAMQVHAADCAVQAKGCAALRGLSSHETTVTEIMKLKPIPLMMRMMNKHIHDASVLREGCDVMVNLTRFGFASGVIEAGALPLVIRIMSSHARNLVLVERVCCTLLAFAVFATDSMADICKAGGVEAIFVALRDNATNNNIVIRAEAVLNELQACQVCKARIEEIQKKGLVADALDPSKVGEGFKIIQCVMCAKTAPDAGLRVLLKCSGCTLAPRYCSADCQRAHWKKHKKDCAANPKLTKA